MEDDEFEWNQCWIDLYWAEADKTLKIREEERESWRPGEKRKRTRGKGEGLDKKKKLKVSNSNLLL